MFGVVRSDMGRTYRDVLASRIVGAPDIARVLGTTPRSAARSTTTGAAPRRQNEKRLLELQAVVDVLREVMRDEPARLWLRGPVPALDLADRG